MESVELNFFALKDQERQLDVFRRKVTDYSYRNEDDEIRVSLPENEGDESWMRYDVALVNKPGFEEYRCHSSINSNLTIFVVFHNLKDILDKSGSAFEYYFPKKSVSLKEAVFIRNTVPEGCTEISVRPYFLKDRDLYGFIVNHKFRLSDSQEFNKNTQILSKSLDRSGKPNIYFYKDKRDEIYKFHNEVLKRLTTGTQLELNGKMVKAESTKLDVKTYLVGNGKQANSQFLGVRSNGPYRKVSGNIRYVFVFSEITRSLAREIYLGLVGKLFPGQFSGMAKMFDLPISSANVEHVLVKDFDESAISQIKVKLLELQAHHDDEKIFLIPVLPKGFKGVDAAFDAYGYLKLMALKNNSYCQFVTEDTFIKKDQLKWSISNIGLQIFCKLGGAPWLVKPAKSNCLILGLGSVQERLDGKISKFTAYTVCLDSSGDFRYIKPLSSSDTEATYLDGLKQSLHDVLSSEIGGNYTSFVLHVPYKISRKEINVIKNVVSSVRSESDIEVIVIRVNTKHQFLGFSDHNTCVPFESTYVQLSKKEFLIWAEGLQYGKKVLHRRVSEPLYIEFLESREEWGTKRDCLQDILNLTGANWRGFNSKAQPISILYSRLIADFMREFSHLKSVNDMSIVSAESVAPWFL